MKINRRRKASVRIPSGGRMEGVSGGCDRPFKKGVDMDIYWDRVCIVTKGFDEENRSNERGY